MTDQSNSNSGGAALTWQSLHEWAPPEGTWAILWPGYYGPFTACWIHGRWTMCEDSDFDCATIGAVIELPHLVTDAVPAFDEIQSNRRDNSHPDFVAADSVKLVAGFMLDCNAIGVTGAGENLVRSIKERIAVYRAALNPTGD